MITNVRPIAQWRKLVQYAGPAHWWTAEGTCRGCGTQLDWPGAKFKCTNRYKPSDNRRVRPLMTHEEHMEQIDEALARSRQ